ncbi:MAG: HipA N-terminal domain-containing protein [Bacteroidota bacterium]
MRQANVYMHDQLAGVLSETDTGYSFAYDAGYLTSAAAEAVSLTLPLNAAPYTSRIIFPFFDGLIPEGWLLDVAEQNWKLDKRDRMGLLLACCRDCIGAVTILELQP